VDVLEIKPRKATWTQVKAAAHGQWPAILAALVPGITSKQLEGKPAPCPACGGDNRFQFTDEGRGCYICRHCADTSRGFPDGFTLIAACLGISDNEAKDLVGDYLGLNGMEATPRPNPLRSTPANQEKSLKPPHQDDKPQRTPEEIKSTARAIIDNCERGLPVYLKNKGYTSTHHLVNRSHFQLPNSKQFVPAGAFVIPIQNINDLTETISVQYIPEDGKIKYHLKDFKKINGVITIPGDDASPHIAIGTGKATCLAFSLAMGCPTFSLFDDTNLVNNCTKIADLFPGKRVLIIGDNDTSGQNAAHKAARLTQGLAIMPHTIGHDWDDHRQAVDDGDDKATNTRREILRQIKALSPVPINEKNTGLDINYPVLITGLDGVSFSVPFDQAIINYAGLYCRCPISGGKAIVNHDSIHSYELKTFFVPIIAELYNPKIIDECVAFRGKKAAFFKWAVNGGTQEHILALVLKYDIRLGADIINKEAFYNLLQKHTKRNIKISPEIVRFIECLIKARRNKASKLVELDTSKFNHSKLTQAIELINDENVQRLNWKPAIEISKSRKYKAIFFKAHHEQGKTKSLFSELFHDANKRGGAVIVAHLKRLINQTAAELKCFDYNEWDNELSGFPLSALKGLACCLHSFKHDHFLDLLRQADSIFIDESVQVLKVLLTTKDKEIINNELPIKFIEAIKAAIANGAVIYFADADQTNESILHWKELLGMEDKDVFVFTAEAPNRSFKAKISCSTNRRSFKTSIIKSIEKDLKNGVPCVLTVETEKEARAIANKLFTSWPDKNIVLLTGKYCTQNNEAINSGYFTSNIETETKNVDLIIHTSVLGAGFSIKHALPRFKKGYCLFTGEVLAATECLQMMRRFRDITAWEIGLLCCPQSMYMVNSFKDKGTDALEKHVKLTRLEKIANKIKHTSRLNNALFIAAFNWLLNDYEFEISGQLSVDELIPGLQTLQELTEADVLATLSATPCSLEDAQKAEKINYSGYPDERRYSCYHALILDCYKLRTITEEAVWRWNRYGSRKQDSRFEWLIKILKLDPTIPNVELLNQILLDAGITLELLNTNQITRTMAEELTHGISKYCLELEELGLLDEHHCRKPGKNVAPDRPLRFVSEWFKSLGFEVEVVRTQSKGSRPRSLTVKPNNPMISRLSLVVELNREELKQTDKQALKEKVLSMYANGKSDGVIAKELGLENRFKVMRIRKNS